MINSIFETEELRLSKRLLTYKKNRPVKKIIFEISIKEINSVCMKPLKMNSFSMFGNFNYIFKMQKSFGGGIEMPAIISGTRTQYFFENANDAEQEWITKALDAMVKQTDL